MQAKRIASLAAAALIVGSAAYFLTDDGNGAEVNVSLPALTEAGQRGQAAFATFCASCHGISGGGTEKGPPLIHKIYHPGHHGDAAIASAALNGARAHHWPYGDMPPVEGISEAQIRDIIAFIREVQHANGIF